MKQEYFHKWLAENGAEVLNPTNEYEFARFRAKGTIFVIYQNKCGELSAQGFSEMCLKACHENRRMDLSNPPPAGKVVGPLHNLPPTFEDTLRDVFAGQALQGLLANPNVVGFSSRTGWEPVNCTWDNIAETAMHLGKAMLRARRAT